MSRSPTLLSARLSRVVGGLCVAAGLTVAAPAVAAPEERPGVIDELDELKWELGGLFAVITLSGIDEWRWGSAPFRFNSEGWFGMDTGSGGQDKVGHAFSSYLMTEFLFLQLREKSGGHRPVTVYPALFTWMLMAYVEVFDGFSDDHGFAYEDLITDSAGIGLSLARNLYPPLARVVDYRMEYLPSAGTKRFHPMIDYSGQKFLLAFKPAGVPVLDRTWLRYSEVLVGYYTRGFMKSDEDVLPDKRTNLFVGIGINLEQVIREWQDLDGDYPGTGLGYALTTIRSFQLPNSYPSVTIHQRRWPHDNLVDYE